MNRTLLFFVAFLLSLPATSFAFDLQLAGGIKGGMNGSAVNGVPEGDPYVIDGVEYPGLVQGPDIYPMFGIGAGVGGVFEIRFLDIVGLETGVIHSWDNGNGWEDKNDPNGRKIGRVAQEQRTRALHFPIMARASVPGLVRPTFGLGFEIVKQLSSTYTYRSGEFDVTTLNDHYTITESTYPLFAFSFGLEVDLGQIRIPIELRGGYNIGFKKDLIGRAEASGNPGFPDFEYDGRYEGHFALYTGVIYQYDLEL